MKLLILMLPILWMGCNLSGGESNNYDLSYDFRISRSCSGRFCKPDDNEQCDIAKTYANQAEYCEGLRDDTMNIDPKTPADSKVKFGCGRRERKALYYQRCGSNFEDTNVQGWTVSCPNGTDEVSGSPLFANRAVFCSDLNNPAYTECSTALRNDKAYRYDCGPLNP